MKRNRRQFMQLCVVGACSAVVSIPSLAAVEDDWKPICKAWMAILLPADAKGPGADHPAVWKAIAGVMRRDAGTDRRYRYFFGQLQDIGAPESAEQLKALLSAGSPVAGFLSELQKTFVEAYFSADVGWHDIGIHAPPQPGGFSPSF